MSSKHVRQWDHDNSPLLWVEMIYRGDTWYMRHYFGFEFGGHYFVNQKQKAIFYKNLLTAKQAKEIGKKKYGNHKFIQFFCRESKKLEAALQKNSQKLFYNKLKPLNNTALVKLFFEFFELNCSLYALYRFTRPDFYEDIIREIQSRYLNIDINLYFQKDTDLKINIRDKKILKDLKIIGQVRYDMHSIWLDSFTKGSKLFQEIGRRINLDSLEVQNCTSQEIISMLKGGKKITKPTIKRRIDSFKLTYLKNGFKLTCPYKHREEDKSIDTIKGAVAYPGRVRGAVVIIPESLSGSSMEKIKKMSDKNILVTVMTSPDMVPAMKKAAAIVTDEGGILCHAAIISRELKTPCVISTRIATQALQDGDFIEVDANDGIITKLNKKE